MMQNIEKHNLKKRCSFVVITLLLFVSSTFKHNKGQFGAQVAIRAVQLL